MGQWTCIAGHQSFKHWGQSPDLVAKRGAHRLQGGSATVAAAPCGLRRRFHCPHKSRVQYGNGGKICDGFQQRLSAFFHLSIFLADNHHRAQHLVLPFYRQHGCGFAQGRDLELFHGAPVDDQWLT
jgi:hypothetical protein